MVKDQNANQAVLEKKQRNKILEKEMNFVEFTNYVLKISHEF